MDKVHTSVLVNEVIENLNLKENGIYVDLTLGAGGHSVALLKKMSGKINIIGIDRDAAIISIAKETLAEYPEQCHVFHASFVQLPVLLKKHGIESVDGVLMDIGVSSLQLDQASKGFSLQKEGPLDMRMNINDNLTAEDVVNNYSEFDLAKIIFEYGEERKSRQIARAIVSYRQKENSFHFRIGKSCPEYFKKRGKIHPATLTFQALRIEVNQELDQLQTILEMLPEILNPGGRIAVISFHSLEDRIVKHFFKEHTGLSIVTKKPITATPEEIRFNPRSRSAKLRCAEVLTE